jgi:hypothetical protein
MEQIIKIVLAIIFALAVVAKLSNKSKDVFEKSGYGLAFMYAIAFAQIVFAIGLFTRYDLWAAIGLFVIMVGAFVTLIRQHVAPANYILAVLSLVLLTSLLFNKVNGIFKIV